MDLRAGEVIDDKYEVVRLIGRGGMGAVYEGRHRRIHRRVAIKVLHSVIAGDRSVVQRFEREAQAAGRIGSEHIVEVLDIGELESGERYMVMEFLEGRSLSARLAVEGQLLPEHAFPIAAELLEGLAAAHEAGIVHRDLKPDNIWLAPSASGRGEFVKILDFGVSKFRTADREADVTQTGIVIGTPSYMAPEQARADRDIDARADVYAVGIILYRCLAGQLPYAGATYNELMFKVVLDDPPPLDQVVPGLDDEVVAIVHRALERDRERRHPSARAFRNALVGWLQRNGFPVSLAVVDLLQSGDRVGAELLQSGEAWRRDEGPFFGEPAPLADAPTRAERRVDFDGEASVRLDDPSREVPLGGSFDGEAFLPAAESFDGEASLRIGDPSIDLDDFDGALTARQTPLSKRDRPRPKSALIETTELLDAGALAAMSRADRRDAIAQQHAEQATIERRLRPAPLEMTTRMTSAVSTPPAPRATGVTIAVGGAVSVLLIGLLVGIGIASGEEELRAVTHLGAEVDRIARAAGLASDAEEVAPVETTPPPEEPTSDEEAEGGEAEAEGEEAQRDEAPRPRPFPRPVAPKKGSKGDQSDSDGKGGRTFRRDL